MGDVFKPDLDFFSRQADFILRRSKVPPDDVHHIEINCGSGSGAGCVVRKDGSKVQV